SPGLDHDGHNAAYTRGFRCSTPIHQVLMTVLRHKRWRNENFKKSLAGRCRRCAVGGRGNDPWETRGEAAGGHPHADTVDGLLVDFTLAHHAAESLLQMVAGTAEPVVKLELAQRGVEVVAPQQADHPAAGPHAFRLSGGARQEPGRLGKLVELLLLLLGRVGGRGGGRLLRLLRRLLLAGGLSGRPLHGRENGRRWNGRENQRGSEEGCAGTRKERGHGRPDDARATELTRTHCNTRIGHLCGAESLRHLQWRNSRRLSSTCRDFRTQAKAWPWP